MAIPQKTLRSFISYFPTALTGAVRMKNITHIWNSDSIILNDIYLLHAPFLKVLGYRGRIITWVRLDYTRYPKWLARLWLEIASRYSDEIVAVSDFIMRKLVADGLKARKIYDPIQPDLFRTTGPLGSSPHAVMIANYTHSKGQMDALEAFARAARHVPDACLSFFGGDLGLRKNREFRTQLEQRSAELGLSERVRFSAFCDDVSKCYADARVALVLSESESFSLTCLEACQVGVPVIAYRSGGPEEIVQDGRTGYLCALGQVDEVAARLRQLLENRELAATLGSAASRRVAVAFSTNRYARAMRDLIDVAKTQIG